MHIHKIFTSKHLKPLQHVSILRSSSGSSLKMILGSKHVGAILKVLM